MGEFALLQSIERCDQGYNWRTYYLGTVRIRRPILPDHIYIVWYTMDLEGVHIEPLVLHGIGLSLCFFPLAASCLLLLA